MLAVLTLGCWDWDFTPSFLHFPNFMECALSVAESSQLPGILTEKGLPMRPRGSFCQRSRACGLCPALWEGTSPTSPLPPETKWLLPAKRIAI